MRARDSWLGGLLIVCLSTGYAFAQATDEPSLDNEPYNKHHDRHFGHDHVYPDRGAIFRDLPKGATIVNYAGLPYRYASGVWFEPRGPVFIVVLPPIGVVVPSLPPFATSLELGGESYFYANDTYYLARPELGGYEVVNDPADMAPTSSKSGPGNNVMGDSAVPRAAPIPEAMPVAPGSSGGATPATNAAAPAVAGVAAVGIPAGSAAAPVGASAANAAGGVTAVSRSMAAGAGVATGSYGATIPTGAVAPSVASTMYSGTTPAAAYGPNVATGPTPAAGAPAPGTPYSSVGPTRTTTPYGTTASIAPNQATAPAAPTVAPYPAVATYPTVAGGPISSAPSAGASSPYVANGPTQPMTIPAPSGGYATVPADMARMQTPANYAPAAAAPTVPVAAPTYGAPTYGAPTYAPAAGTAAAAVAAPQQAPPPAQSIPPGVSGIPILGSGSSGGPKLMAYARNGQSAERQARDHYDCYQFGIAQSGYDPMRAGYGVTSTGNQAEFASAQAACFEGRGYTVR
jgi:hypothetical protein